MVLQKMKKTAEDYLGQEVTEAVLRQSADLDNLVTDLLVIAKTDMGNLTLSRVPVSLGRQATLVLEEFDDPDLPGIPVSGSAPTVMGDPARVRQILRNLLSNARRYGGNEVRVEIARGDRTAQLRVTDNGPGVPPEDRERIFERHQRAHHAPGLTAALGIGLSIARDMARLMGGDLTYRRRRGLSIFELSLPTS